MLDIVKREFAMPPLLWETPWQQRRRQARQARARRRTIIAAACAGVLLVALLGGLVLRGATQQVSANHVTGAQTVVR